MNYFKELAKLLGVELEEEFQIKNSNLNYKFTENGLFVDCNYNGKFEESFITLNDLTPDKIIRMPYKPKYRQKYYTICFENGINVKAYVWYDDEIDSNVKKINLVFRTREEAEKAAKEIEDFLKNRR